jgi:O-antigen/teichoic acid export membrane protein
MTISSVGGWVGVLDFGIGNGLRNKLCETLARGENVASKEYLSSAYVSLLLALIGLTILFLFTNMFLNWSSLLNAPQEMRAELTCVAAVFFGSLGIRLGLGLVNALLLADQQPALVSMFDSLGMVITLVSVHILSSHGEKSLIWFGLTSSYGPVLILLLASVILFSTKYRHIAPRWRDFRFHLAMDMTSLGFKFFALQIAAVVIFATTSVIIAHMFGPEEVSRYAIAQRYYGIPLTVFAILLTPYWSAYTQAYVLGEIKWIRSSINQLKRYLALLAVALVMMTIFADKVYSMWLDSNALLPGALSGVFIAYVLISSWCTIHVNLINGTGRIGLQMIVGLTNAILFVPLAILIRAIFLNDSACVLIAVCVLLLPSCILWPIQVKKILNGTASGIWAV